MGAERGADEAGADRPLTFRQRMFVVHYLGKANGNSTEAARLAGFSHPNSRGPRLLNVAGVRSAIEAKVSTAGLRAAEVLGRLADMASADLGDFEPFFTKGEAGVPVFDLAACKAAGLSYLVRSVKRTQHGDTLVLHDALDALDKLMRYHGLFRDRLDVTSGDQPFSYPTFSEVRPVVRADPLDGNGDAPPAAPRPDAGG